MAEVETSDGTATVGVDYDGVSETVRFADGDTADKLVTIQIFHDMEGEWDETINLNLRNPVGGAMLGALHHAVLTIQETDAVIEFESDHYSAYESNPDVVVAFWVRGKGGAGVTVDLTTADKTAIAGLDYTIQSGNFSFPGMFTGHTLHIPIINNDRKDGIRTFTVSLSHPAGGAILGKQASTTVTIFDDEDRGFRVALHHPAPGQSRGVEVWGKPSRRYWIEASTNLLDWITIGSGTNDSGGLEIPDVESAGFSQRFYRARCEEGP